MNLRFSPNSCTSRLHLSFLSHILSRLALFNSPSLYSFTLCLRSTTPISASISHLATNPLSFDFHHTLPLNTIDPTPSLLQPSPTQRSLLKTLLFSFWRDPTSPIAQTQAIQNIRNFQSTLNRRTSLFRLNSSSEE